MQMNTEKPFVLPTLLNRQGCAEVRDKLAQRVALIPWLVESVLGENEQLAEVAAEK